jgi:hypothetical protein
MLLALDIASNHTGFAYGGENDAAPVVGIWALDGGSDLPLTAGAMIRKVSRLCAEISATDVVIERPVLKFKYRDKKTGRLVERSQRTAFVLGGLVVAAAGAAHNAGVTRIRTTSVTTWRKQFTGRGRYTKREVAKESTRAMCERLGWKVGTDDEADAAGLWCFAMSSLYPKWAPRGTPLFARGVA